MQPFTCIRIPVYVVTKVIIPYKELDYTILGMIPAALV